MELTIVSMLYYAWHVLLFTIVNIDQTNTFKHHLTRISINSLSGKILANKNCVEIYATEYQGVDCLNFICTPQTRVVILAYCLF